MLATWLKKYFFKLSTFKKLFKFIVLPYFFLSLVLNLESYHHQFEGALYENKYLSLINEYDLNIVNNAYPNFSMILSPTDNAADMHEIGAPALWFSLHEVYTFFWDKNDHFFEKNNGKRVYPPTLLVAITHLFLIILLINKIKQFLNLKSHWLPTLVLFALGAYCLIFDNFLNADILAFILTTYLLIELAKIKDFDNESKLNIYGIGFFIGVLVIVRITSIFFLPAILFFIFQRTKNKKVCWKNYLRIFFGLFICFVMVHINQVVVFGNEAIFQGYKQNYSLNHLTNLSSALAIFIYPNGLFLNSLVLASTFPIAFYLYFKRADRKNIKNQLAYLCLISPLAKLLLPFLTISNANTGFGGSQFLIDYYPIFIIFYNFYLSHPWLARLLMTVSLTVSFYLFYSWNFLLQNYETYHMVPEFYFKEASETFLIHVTEIFSSFNETFFLFKNAKALLPLIIFFLFIYLGLKLIKIRKRSIFILGGILISFCLYATHLNLSWNYKNSDQYFRRNGYDKKIIGNGLNVFLLSERISNFILAEDYERKYGSANTQTYVKKLKESYLDQAANEVLFIGKDVFNIEMENKLLNANLKPQGNLIFKEFINRFTNHKK